MQKSILAANPASRIRIFAVNDQGYESGVPPSTGAGRTLPILQDSAEVGAWGLWSAQYRDLVFVDGEGTGLGTINLTSHDLQDPDEYDAVLAFLRLAAGE